MNTGKATLGASDRDCASVNKITCEIILGKK